MFNTLWMGIPRQSEGALRGGGISRRPRWTGQGWSARDWTKERCKMSKCCLANEIHKGMVCLTGWIVISKKIIRSKLTKGSLEVKLLTIYRDEKQRWEIAPCGILLVWTHISKCSSPFSWWNFVTSSPPLTFEENALDLEAVWPFGVFFGVLWHWVYIKKVPGTEKNQWCVSQKKKW